MVAGGFANKNAKNAQYPGMSTASSPRAGFSKGYGGSAVASSAHAGTTPVDGARGGAEAPKKVENGGRSDSGGMGRGVPAPSSGCEEAFSNQKALQQAEEQPEEQPRGPQTAQVGDTRGKKRACIHVVPNHMCRKNHNVALGPFLPRLSVPAWWESVLALRSLRGSRTTMSVAKSHLCCQVVAPTAS